MKSYRWRELDNMLLRRGFTKRHASSSHAVYCHHGTGLTATLVVNHLGCNATAGAIHTVLKLCREVDEWEGTEQ